ncbi:MAG TPA: SLBB domain-containing protein, partial [Solirubrobacteraceae bacterium]|nr:SLBB domain-containing protein [Solirubrobacteraceae bacterium]
MLTESLPRTGERPPAALPRLLAGVPPSGALSLPEHVAIHGPLPATSGRGRRRARERAALLVDEIERSGLLGRGGAAFPTATKMRAVASARRRAIVVVNAAEGEPASRKDGTLLETLPHLVLDGGILAAEAVGADEVIVCVCESADAGIKGMARAIEERAAAAERSPSVRLATVPGHYVAGQESALINYLNGGPAKPTFTPPLPFERGVRRRPTLVNNAETLAHLALIARHGAPWFRQLGTPSQPGSALVTLSGPLAHPGVYEVEHGASLASLIQAAGGSTADVHGALIGGYGGSWVAGGLLKGVALSNEHLAAHGASLG